MRDEAGRTGDFSFGYGNPSIDAYVRVCETGEPWVYEVTYDTPFGDGYMLGTWVHRTARLVNFLTDVTEQRRMEAELRSYADVVAHDLGEPIAGIATLVGGEPRGTP